MKPLTIRHVAAVMLLSMLNLYLYGQGAVIGGRISGEKGKALPGATVMVSGTFTGAVTDINGNYRLNVGRDGTYELKVSFIGYETVSRVLRVTGVATADFELLQMSIPAAEVVVSAVRAGSQTPVTCQTLDAGQIKKNNFGTDIPFLLSLTPSLVETSETGNGIGYTALRIRGSDASRINITIDGIPVNDAESQQVFWVNMPDFASTVESIQVQRGVGTSGNGAGAFGASVNMQTVSPGTEPMASVTTAIGSFKTRRLSLIAGTGALGNRLSLMMRYSSISSNGYIRHSAADNRSMFITGVYSSGRSRLKANILIGEEHTGLSWYGISPEMMAIDRRYNMAGAYIDHLGQERYYDDQKDNYWQNHYHMIYSLNIGNGLLLHSAIHLTGGKGYYEQYKASRKLNEYGLQPLVIGDTTIYRSDIIQRKWNEISFFGLTWALKYNSGGTDATIGGAANRHDGDHFGRILWMQYAGNTEKDNEWYLNHALKDEFNIYGKINQFILPRLSVFADIQMRLIHYIMEGTDDNLSGLEMQKNHRFFNPKAGIYFSPSSTHDLFASVAVAHREPTRANYKDAMGDPAATPMPERLTDFEAGYSLKKPGVNLNINLYYMSYRNQLVPTGELSTSGYPIMTNVHDSYRTGVEISLAAKPASFLQWNQTLTLSSNKIKKFVEYYTDYNTSDWSEEYRSKARGSVDIAYSPSLIASGELVISPFTRAELRLSGKYVGSQYFDNTMSNYRKLEPYFVANSVLSYNIPLKMTQEALISMAINNMFNNLYVSNAYGGNWYEDGIEKSWAYYFPQAGINWMLRLSLSF